MRLRIKKAERDRNIIFGRILTLNKPDDSLVNQIEIGCKRAKDVQTEQDNLNKEVGE